MENKPKTINQIIKDIRSQVTLSPREVAEYRMILSAEYSYQMEKLSGILKRKPKDWMEIRQKVGSDSQAEKQYAITADGQQEIELKHRLKYMEKMISSLRQMLEVFEKEIMNQY